MKTGAAFAIAFLLAGCATASAPLPPGAQTYVGEVRNWNAKDNTVTLYQPGSTSLVQVKVTPEQLVGLDLNRTARVQGVRVEPADLHVLVPTGPMTPVPKAPAEMLELRGTVTTVDPAGRVVISTDRGPVRILTAAGADQRFTPSSPVIVRMSVQPVDLVPAPASGAAALPTPMPVSASASPTSEPGDHAVSTGRVLSVNPPSLLVVEAPSGSVQVVVGDAARYTVGQFVQVRTTARATP
jgi:hypothetical protein